MSQPSATQVLLHLPDIAEGNRKACVPVARDRVARLVMIFVLLFAGPKALMRSSISATQVGTTASPWA